MKLKALLENTKSLHDQMHELAAATDLSLNIIAGLSYEPKDDVLHWQSYGTRPAEGWYKEPDSVLSIDARDEMFIKGVEKLLKAQVDAGETIVLGNTNDITDVRNMEKLTFTSENRNELHAGLKKCVSKAFYAPLGRKMMSYMIGIA